MSYIIKWHIGNVSDAGLDCLDASVASFKKFYPDAEFHIFYNQIDPQKLSHLNVLLHDQLEWLSCFHIKPLEGYQVHWKLYPPRFDQNRHEISVDNDIVIFNKVREIDLFLQSNHHTLLYQGLHGLHGSFSQYVPKGIRINSGIFGMPPNFDFHNHMKDLMVPDRWKDKFDEQGLIASVLLKSQKYFIVPLTTIPILESDFDLRALTNSLCCGYHFVGVNYVDNHMCWNEYHKKIVKHI